MGPSRDRLGLSPGYGGAARFTNPEVRAALLAEVEWLVREIRPACRSLATEIQGDFLAHPDEYDAFASLAREAYDRVRSIRPQTLVFVHFQYEAIYRDFLGGPAAAAQNLAALVAPFEPKLDRIGFRATRRCSVASPGAPPRCRRTATRGWRRRPRIRWWWRSLATRRVRR
ncbi:MAG: hypothetical protein U0610_21105 [bacterium]